MARHSYDPSQPTAGFRLDELASGEEIASHRRETYWSKAHSLLAAGLGTMLLTGIGLTVVGMQPNDHPVSAYSREDDDRASRGDDRLETPQTLIDANDLTSSLRPSPPATRVNLGRGPQWSSKPRASSGAKPVPATPAPAPTTKAPAPAPTTKMTTTTKAPTAAPAATSTPADQRTIQAFVTGYSYFDNTPPGSATISHPILHKAAGGTGTYVDPITVAVGHSLSDGRDVLDWAPGTRFYLPNLRRYFLVEDTCGDGSSPQNGPCHTGYPAPATTWLDIWIGGEGGSVSGSDACMNAITGVWQVLVNPGPNYATVAGSVYGAGGCTRQYGNAVVAG